MKNLFTRTHKFVAALFVLCILHAPLFIASSHGATYSRFAYVTNNGSNTVSIYTVDSTTGALWHNSYVMAGTNPNSVAVDPSGRFAYVANHGSNNVSVYTIDQTTGALTVGTTVAAGTNPKAIAVDPSGRFAYVANQGSNNVSVYTIDQTTGALTAGTAVAAGTQAHSVTVHPTGKFAYVANQGSSNVSVYTIDQTTGALTAGTAVAAGNTPISVTVDPTGRFAYAANLWGNNVSVYTIDQTTGALTAGTTVAAGTGTWSVAVDPNGKFAYATNNTSNNVSVYTIDQTTGALTAGTAVAAGSFPSSVTFDPAGKFAYVTNINSNNVIIYMINQTTGALTLSGTISTQLTPTSIAMVGGGAAVAYVPKFAYVANAGLNYDVSAYTISPITGALTEVSGSPFAAGTGNRPHAITVHPTGKFAYTANFYSANISVFTINQTTGALTAGTAVATGSGPHSIAMDPSGRFVYVGNALSNNVSVYTIDQTTGALTAGTAVAAGTNPCGVIVDPSGRFAYVTNDGSNDVSVYTIDQTTGALTAGTAVAAGTNPFKAAVDPSGRFAYVVNVASNNISAYTIDQSTGALTQISGSPFASGTGPRGIAIDPSGRFAYVASQFSNDVSVYTIDQTTGALTAGTPVAAGPNSYAIAVDPSGKFVYVTSLDSNSLWAYTINQTTGALTAGAAVAAGIAPSAVTTTWGIADVDLNYGLVAYYPFSGNANDESGKGNNGTVNGATLTADRFGNVNKAYSFDGTSNYIDVGNPIGNNPSIITQCAWALTTTPSQDSPVMTKRHVDDGSDWSTIEIMSSNIVRFWLDDKNYNTSWAVSPQPITDLTWYFICGIRNGTSYKLYIDGNLVNEVIDSHSTDGSSYNMHIGHYGAAGRYFKGSIDDVRIYNRALSDAEVQALYHHDTHPLMGGSIQGIPINVEPALVSTFAGTAFAEGSTDGTGVSARFSSPHGATTDGTNLYVTDAQNHTIRKAVITTGAVTTLAGSPGQAGSIDGTGAAARFNKPAGITTDGTTLYIADMYNHIIRKVVITTGAVTTLAGSPGQAGSNDGTGSAARFNYPAGITTDGTNLYVAEYSNYTIRKVVIATGEVTTLAGSAGSPGSTDGTGSAARFKILFGITTDGTNLYAIDEHTIRKVVIATGAVTTLAGSSGVSGSTDGTGAAARFYYPYYITTDGTNLYVPDSSNRIIRKIVISSGVVTTIAGSVGISTTTDGTGAAARFFCPIGATTDGNNLYVVDGSTSSTIRKITQSSSYTLTVTKSGTGTGSVTASTGAISWAGNSGTASYDNSTSVTLTATPASGSTFTGWSGACTNTTGTCTVTMDAGKNVTATFTDNIPPTTTPSTSGGTFASAQTITLTTEAGATIWYTKDGSDPTNLSGTRQSCTGTCSIPITTTTILKYYSVDVAGNPESVKTETYTIAANGYWTTTGSMTVARAWHTATLLPNGKVLITGGDIGSTATVKADLYDPSTGIFTATGNMIEARATHAATLLPNGKVVIMGGNNNSYSINSAELYDPNTGTFTPTGSMNQGRNQFTATLLQNGKILIAGGGNNTGILGTAELFDPANGTFSTTGNMTSPRQGHQATLLANGKILIAGGDPGGNTLNSAEIYDPNTGTFTSTGNMNTARRGIITARSSMLLANGKVLVTGGDNNNAALNSAELYNPATGTFSSTGSMINGRIQHTATVLLNSKVLVAGGASTANNYGQVTAEIYDPATGTFTATGSMANGRFCHTETLLPNGQVLVTGGYPNAPSGTPSIASAELFNPNHLMGGSMQGTAIAVEPALVSTFAGTAGATGSTDGTGTAARFNNPNGITTDGTNLYVAGLGDHTIRKVVIATGVVTTLAGSAGATGSTDGTGTAARFNLPAGITTDGTNLYVADDGNHTIRKVVIATGAVTTLAGSAGAAGSTDGTGTAARFSAPTGITTDGTNLYVGEYYNHTIRKVVIATGVVTTIAGSAGATGSTDGTGTAARFNNPGFITTDGMNLYVLDSYNHTIRKVVIATGVVTTIAGSAGATGSTDGTGTAARFNIPGGIMIDGTNLYVSDTYNHTIRKVVIATGVVTTIAGSASATGSTDGTGTAALFNFPALLTTDGTNLYLTESGNHTIRKITQSNTLTVTKSGNGSGSVTANTGTIAWSGNTGTATYNSGTSVTLTAAADASSIFTGWSGSCTNTTGTCTVTMDASKNVTAAFALSDTTPPTGSVGISGGASSTNSQSVTLTLSATDTANTVTQMRFSTDNSIWTDPEPYATTKTITLPSGDGQKTVYVKFKDGANNWSPIYNVPIILDKTGPTVSATPQGGTFITGQNVTLTPNENATIYYTIDGTTPSLSSSVYASAIPIASTSTLKFFGKDALGNIGAIKTETYSIQDFTITANNMKIVKGDTRQSIITFTAISGFNSFTTLIYQFVGTAPTGVTVTLNPDTILPTSIGTNATLQCALSSSASSGTYALRITATGGDITRTKDIQIAVVSSMDIAVTPLSEGIKGQVYSADITASGGIAPYTFSVVPGLGSLPGGLTLGASGTISGTPTTRGTSTFTIQALDSDNHGATKEYSIRVYDPAYREFFLESPSWSAEKSVLSDIITVKARDDFGSFVELPSQIQIKSSSTSGRFLLLDGSQLSFSNTYKPSIPAGTTFVDTQYSDSKVGVFTVTVSGVSGNVSASWQSVSHQMTITSPTLKTATLTIASVTQNATYGQGVTIIGTLKEGTTPCTGKAVSFTFTAPSGTTITGSSTTTNSSGGFTITEGFATIDAAGNWSVTASAFKDDIEYNEASATKAFTIAKADTGITLFLDANSIAPTGSTLTITGKLSSYMAPDSLNGVSITIDLTDSNGTVHSKTATTSSTGYFNATYNQFNGITGLWTVQARLTDAGNLNNSESVTKDLTVATSAGYVILIQGDSGGQFKNNYGLSLDDIYKKLKKRSFKDENIYYLSFSGTTHDSGVVVNEFTSKAKIQEAITTWAYTRITTGGNAPLYIVMMDHGSNGKFYLDTEYITPNELNDWITTLENHISHPITTTIINGSCYSGSFIPALSKQGRIIITSSSDEEESAQGPNFGSKVYGEYFIYYLFASLSRGENIRDAFKEAAQTTHALRECKGSSCGTNSLAKSDNSRQHPLLDDNGDGKGSWMNIVGQEDGSNTARLVLGLGANPVILSWAEVSPTTKVSPGSPPPALYAKTSGVADGSWIEIKKPSHVQEGGGTGQVIMNLTTVTGNFNENKQQWEYPLPNLAEPGTYTIYYYAADSNYDIIPPAIGTVYMDTATNNPPSVPTLITPANEQEVNDGMMIFSWTPAVDADPVTYTIKLYENNNGVKGNEIKRYELISNEFLSINATKEKRVGGTTLFVTGSSYLWEVEAIDDKGRTSTSTLFKFNVTFTNATTSIITGIIYSNIDYARITTATLTLNGTTSIPISSNGSFVFRLLPGTASLSVVAPGYSVSSLSLASLSGEITTKDIALTPQGNNFTLSVSQGWNFVSFSTLPSASAPIGTVLGDVSSSVRVVWGYDNQTKAWLKYRGQGSGTVGQNTLTNIETGKGYWIYMNNPAILSIAGQPPASTAITLHNDWNLVGYNGTDGTLSPPANYIIIWGWENGVWKAKKASGVTATVNAPELTTLEKGRAYWIKTTEGVVWNQ